MTEFFTLSTGLRRGALRLTLVDLDEDAFSRLRGKSTAPPPAIDKQQGSRIGDLIAVDGGLNLISPRLQSALSPFSGWTTFRFELVGRAARLAPELNGYAGLSVLGRAGRVDLHRSTRVLKQPTGPGNPMEVLRGIHFEDDRWDGSDVFLADGWRAVFVSAQVASALAGLRNVELESTDDYEVPAYELDLP